MLKQSAPIILIVSLFLIFLEACKVDGKKVSFGWLGVFGIGLYVLLASVIP